MVWESGHTVVVCPRCKEQCVTAFRRPSYGQGKTSRISAGAKTTVHRTAEKFYIQGDCPKCGMKNQDIQKHYDGQERKAVSYDEAIKRLRDAGLPTRIES